MTKQSIFVLPILLSGIILFYLLYQNKTQLAETFFQTNPYWIVIAGLFILANLFLHGAKWKILLDYYHPTHSLVYTTQVFCAGTIIGFFTPLKLGVFIRALFIPLLNKTQSIATILVDRLSDLLLVGVIGSSGLIAWSLYTQSLQNETSVLVVLFMLALAIFFLALHYRARIQRIAHHFFQNLPFKRFHSNGKAILAEIKVLSQICPRLTRFIGFGIAAFLTGALYYFAVSQALQVTISFSFLIVMVAVTFLIEALPIAALGFGTREAFWSLAAPFVGLTTAQAILLPFMATILNYGVVCLVGSSILLSSRPQENQ